MYLSRCNWDLGVAVWWVTGFQSDEDWELEFADMRALMAHSPAMPFRPAVLLYLNCSLPNAKRRKQLAEMSAIPAYNPYLACVTTDPELRGAQVAMSWAGPPAACEKVVFETIDEGLGWLEERRGTPLMALRFLATSVKNLAERRRPSPSDRPGARRG
jgi:hypothetical protein